MTATKRNAAKQLGSTFAVQIDESAQTHVAGYVTCLCVSGGRAHSVTPPPTFFRVWVPGRLHQATGHGVDGWSDILKFVIGAVGLVTTVSDLGRKKHEH
jgi:hypothetical protein